MNWTAEDERNLKKWTDDKGFRLVYFPKEQEWGFYQDDKPTEIKGGFQDISELKQYFVNLKGDEK